MAAAVAERSSVEAAEDRSLRTYLGLRTAKDREQKLDDGRQEVQRSELSVYGGFFMSRHLQACCYRHKPERHKPSNLRDLNPRVSTSESPGRLAVWLECMLDSGHRGLDSDTPAKLEPVQQDHKVKVYREFLPDEEGIMTAFRKNTQKDKMKNIEPLMV